MTMTFSPEILDELLKDYQSPEDLLGDGGILKQLTKALVERHLLATIAATAIAKRRSRVSLAKRRSRFLVTAVASSSRNWSRRGRRALTGLMTRFYRCMPGG
jgi:hypothetical protein